MIAHSPAFDPHRAFTPEQVGAGTLLTEATPSAATSTAVRKVLQVTHYFPPHIGGIEVVAQEEALRLTRLGLDVIVLTSACGAEERDVMGNHPAVRRLRAWNPFERFGVPFPIFGIGLLFTGWKLVRWSDVVHIHDTLYMSSWVIAALCRILGRPYVTTQHVVFVQHPSRVVCFIQHVVRLTAARFVLHGAARVLAINRHVARDVEHSGASLSRRLQVVPNGVDCELFRPPADDSEKRKLRCSLGFPKDDPIVLFVGRFVPKKGFDVLADAESMAYRIAFVGGDRPARISPGTRHIFMGSLPHTALAEVYRAADVFACPSVGELLPLTMLEAMASGLPVVIWDDSLYCGQLCDSAGIISAADYSGGVCEALARITANRPDLRRMSRRAVEMATRSFSWDAHARTLVSVYGETGDDKWHNTFRSRLRNSP